MTRMNIGVIGCGTISGIYLQNLPAFQMVNVAAVADLAPERAAARAAQYGIPRACTVAELLADPSIELVVNLTPPDAHAAVAQAIVEAGKSVYNEKPLTLTRAEAQGLRATARSKGVRVGCAPDTFLGGGIQTCRRLMDENTIGAPVAATAFMLSHGPEDWHPNPAFYYQPGAGPMFDMGPYYLTALVNLLGPARRVSGMARISFPERRITSEPHYGERIPVRTATHVAGLIDFECGAIATIITSFDVWAHSLPRIEIYGETGTLGVPDPNTFGGPVRMRAAGESEWRDMPIAHGYTTNSRGVGVADMAHAMRSGRAHRANDDVASHVLDLMHAFHESSSAGRHVDVSSRCERPAALPAGLPEGVLDN